MNRSTSRSLRQEFLGGRAGAADDTCPASIVFPCRRNECSHRLVVRHEALPLA